jgi:hypothetical protein
MPRPKAEKRQERLKAPNPKWWGILAPLRWWLRWSVTILVFIMGTAIGLVVTSVVYVRMHAP